MLFRSAPVARRLWPVACLLLSAAVAAQGIGTEWPTYNGDYSGRRFSALAQINTTTVKSLSLAWIYQTGAAAGIKATPLVVNGVVYLSTQDNAYAIEARTGRELWHYVWKSQGGNHLSNRGVGILGDTVYFETPDCHLIALDRKSTRLNSSHVSESRMPSSA